MYRTELKQPAMTQRIRPLQSLMNVPLDPQGREACWRPSVDVYRAGKAWLVKFDLAGVRKEDIQVILDGQRLTVRGVRRDLTILDGQQAYSMEIDYNQFERVVELPVNVETARFASDYRDGMFLVSITPSNLVTGASQLDDFAEFDRRQQPAPAATPADPSSSSPEGHGHFPSSGHAACRRYDPRRSPQCTLRCATEDKTLVVVAQRGSPRTEHPSLDDLFDIGTKAVIKRMMPAEGVLQIIVQGIERVRISPATVPLDARPNRKRRDFDSRLERKWPMNL